MEQGLGLVTADTKNVVIKRVEHFLQSDDFEQSMRSNIMTKMTMLEA